MDVASRLRDILDEAYDRLGLLGPAAEKAKREMLTVEEEVAELIDEAIGDAADEYTHDNIDDDFLAVHAREIELLAEHIGTGDTAEVLRELHDLSRP